MKKYIFAALASTFILSASAQTEVEVLKITLENGQEQTIAISDIKEMTFATQQTEEPKSPAEQFAGVYTGKQAVTVGGQFTYETTVSYTLTAASDGTLTVNIPQYSLSGTMMGDLTLGAVEITGLAYDEAKGGFYRMYAGDGIKQHFKAVNGGNTVFDSDYELGGESNILITKTDTDIKVVNPFKLGAMPLPLSAEFEGSLDD